MVDREPGQRKNLASKGAVGTKGRHGFSRT
jgi:hypothetical protein